MNEDRWAGLLDEDEQILWEGRPDPSFAMKPRALFGVPFMVFFTGFVVFWMSQAGRAEGAFWLFGLPFLIAGLGGLFWEIWGWTLTRRHTWYSLTTSRAIIATDLPLQGKRLKSYPLDRDTVLDFSDGPFASIYFAIEHHSGAEHHYTTRIGFERIREGRALFQSMRSVQRGLRGAETAP